LKRNHNLEKNLPEDNIKLLKDKLEDFRIKDGESKQEKNYYEPIEEFSQKLSSFFSKVSGNPRFGYKDEFINIGFLAFAPANYSGYKNMCPNKATQYCHIYCVGKSTQGLTQIQAQIKRTILFTQDENFMNNLCIEIVNHTVKSYLKSKLAVFRLNGYSDIKWETKKFTISKKFYNYLNSKLKNISFQHNNHIPKNIFLNEKCLLEMNDDDFDKKEVNIFELFPGILFYDYTKHKIKERTELTNYHLTYSYSKNISLKNIKDILIKQKKNIAFICCKKVIYQLLEGKPFNTKTFNKNEYTFIDGDINDYRFLDDLINVDKGKIVLLCFKKDTEKICNKKDSILNEVIVKIDFFSNYL
jgi:hypothetical protein